jgi:hypothetical protein
LLAWAGTLAEITIEARRVPNGDYVHLSLSGQLTKVITSQVYGVVAFAGCGVTGDFVPNARRPAPLAVLRAMAATEEVSA